MIRKRFIRQFAGRPIIIETDVIDDDAFGQHDMIMLNHTVVVKPTNMTDEGAVRVIRNGLSGGPAAGETKSFTIEQLT